MVETLGVEMGAGDPENQRSESREHVGPSGAPEAAGQ